MNKITFNIGGWFQRAFHLFLVITFFIVSISQVTPAQASSPSQQNGNITTTYSMRVTLPPPPICANQQYNVTVEVDSKSQGIMNGQQAQFSEVLYGVQVDAHSTNTGVAAISPDREVTGDPLLAAPGGDSGPAVAEFTLQAQKAGTAKLVFETMIGHNINSYLGPVIPIKVINCKYKVTLVSSWSFSRTEYGVTIYSHLTQSSQGEMQLSDSGNALDGTATVTWAMSSYAPGCNQSHQLPVASAKLTGTVNQDADTLTVHVAFGQADLSSTHCIGGETGQFAPPEIEFTVPATGGTQGKDHSFQLGGEDLHGYTTVIVTPVEAP